MSLITVGIPTYNASLLIKRTVESVQRQKGGYDVEIVVVDDCSTDDTVQVVERMKLANLRVLRQDTTKALRRRATGDFTRRLAATARSSTATTIGNQSSYPRQLAFWRHTPIA